jgi:hypothetical protein
VWSSSFCSFLQSPVTSFLLGLDILLSSAFSNTLCSSLSVKDEVTQPHITGKDLILRTQFLIPFLSAIKEILSRITSCHMHIKAPHWMLFIWRPGSAFCDYETIRVYIVILSGSLVTASSGCGWQRRPPDMEGSCEYIE